MQTEQTCGHARTERHVFVQIGGVPAALGGPAADLVALLAATPLSPRTLRLLGALLAEEARLAAIPQGRLVVDLGPGQFRLRLEEERPRVVVAP